MADAAFTMHLYSNLSALLLVHDIYVTWISYAMKP